MPVRRTSRAAAGLTLLESLLAAVLLAAAVSSIVWPFAVCARNDQVADRSTVAGALVQEMIEEILAQPFDDPQGATELGPESDENGREDFDNVDDYHGYREDAGQITCFDGQTVTGPAAAGLSRSVRAEYAYVQGQDEGAEPSFVAVTVTVCHGGTAVAEATRLIYRVQ